MPSGLYAQEKACKQEERILSRLQAVQLDTSLMEVMRRQADLLLRGKECLNGGYLLIKYFNICEVLVA
jgi:hypothetical protein